MDLTRWHRLVEENTSERLAHIAVERDFSDEQIEAAVSNLTKDLPDTFRKMSKVLFDGPLEIMPSMLADRTQDLQRFERAHLERWRTPLDRLAAFVEAAREAGAAVWNPDDEARVLTGSATLTALSMLRGRVIQVAREVLVLAEAGYGESRCRRQAVGREPSSS